jgi:(p)ppGpp synthase/HD superfamily hydrolase
MKEENNTILSKAKEFAREAHKDIFFYTASGYKRPQVEHLQEVADLVWAAGGNYEEITAAWMHDIVEDTSVTLENIKNLFGEEIADLVHGLTDGDDIKDLPLLERKTKQSERVKAKSISVRKIKIADQISNVRAVLLDPPQYWLPEKNRDYVIGAKLIVNQCRGISSVLDDLFDQEYAKAVIQFKL